MKRALHIATSWSAALVSRGLSHRPWTLIALSLASLACSRGTPDLDPWELGTGSEKAANVFALGASVQGESHDHAPKEHHQAILREHAECAELYKEIALQPALPGTPRLDAVRELVLARSKAEPVLFLSEPQFTGSVSEGMQARRRSILKSQHPAELIKDAFNLFKGFPDRRRQLLLRDGYLYTDDPRTARYLTEHVTLEELFAQDEIFLERASETYRLVRNKEGVFQFADGGQAGERARLLLFDRVWLAGDTLGPALQLDVRDFAQRLGVEGMQIERITERHILGDLKFGDESVRAVIEHGERKLELICLAVAPDRVDQVGRARDDSYRRAQVLRAMREQIVKQVKEGLPFDEPKTESGQQDGELRRRFEHAYFSGQKTYKFNGDRYQVYSAQGLPLVPQVCIDFVTETLERASGMHWAEQGQPPRRLLGALDFDELLSGHRRQEMALRSFARENPGRLQLLDFPQSEWVAYEKVDAFFEFIRSHKRDFRPGDVLIIRGRAAWDHYHDIHTHTFYIYEADPITQMPTLLAGNSGKPRIITWDDEMLRAPKRSIHHRIRPNMNWLYDHVVLRTPVRGERWAAPLSAAAL